jgi:uncharacterized protein
MANTQGSGTQGGTHEQHTKPGEQSHKNNPAGGTTDQSKSESGSHSTGTGTQGGTHEQHAKAGQQSHKNT